MPDSIPGSPGPQLIEHAGTSGIPLHGALRGVTESGQRGQCAAARTAPSTATMTSLGRSGAFILVDAQRDLLPAGTPGMRDRDDVIVPRDAWIDRFTATATRADPEQHDG